MPKARKNTRAATRSRPRASLLPFLNLKGMFGGVLDTLARGALVLKDWCAVALAWAWRSRAARRTVALAAGVAVCVALSWVMQNNLRSSPRFQVDPARIELAAEPTWARPELAARIKSEIDASLRANVARMQPSDAFDNDLPELLATELAASPWVHRVVRIERRFPADAEGHSHFVTQLEVRRPAVLVEQAGTLIAVDGQARVLPLTVPSAQLAEFQANLVLPLRVIKGVTGKAPSAGNPWVNEQINAALSMETILRKSEIDRTLPIATVELVGVPEKADSRGRVHYADDGGVMLWPDQNLYPGARLIWGRPPVHASTLEPSPNDKFERLKIKLNQPPEGIVGTRIDLRRRPS